LLSSTSSFEDQRIVRRTKRRSAAAVVCALACTFGVDWWLYTRQGFLRVFGQATQEGQIVSKVGRAPAMAANADVIAFGSSYVRSGLSGQPFFDNGLLFWNFGITGTGPMTSYFALKQIAPIVAARSVKPVLLLELKAEAIEQRDDTLWAEYLQYLGLVRSRAERLREAPFLLRVFREQGMTSQYVSSVVIPSGVYRSYNVGLMERRGDLQGYFYGMEDATGFAPLYSIPSVQQIETWEGTQAVAHAWLEGKVMAIRRFLNLARTLGCRVILYASPTVVSEDSGLYDELWSQLKSEFRDVSLLRTQGRVAYRDFDAGGHPNLRGSDALSRLVIDAANLPDRGLDAKIHSVFNVYRIPPLEAWTIINAPNTAQQSTAIGLDGTAPPGQALLATSPVIDVVPDQECVLEIRTVLTRGRVGVRVLWKDPTGHAEYAETVTAPELPEYGRDARVFLRAIPRTAQVHIEITDYGALTGLPHALGRIEPLRFWADRR
jgi:hypothetical protein